MAFFSDRLIGRGTRRGSPRWMPTARRGAVPAHGGGTRTLWGGRAPVRPVFYMGPRGAPRDTPPLHAFYTQLLAAGQGKTVARPAGRHPFLPMLNALLKQRTPWHSPEVQR